MDFKPGDYIKGKPESDKTYELTNSKSICRIDAIWFDRAKVEIISSSLENFVAKPFKGIYFEVYLNLFDKLPNKKEYRKMKYTISKEEADNHSINCKNVLQSYPKKNFLIKINKLQKLLHIPEVNKVTHIFDGKKEQVTYTYEGNKTTCTLEDGTIGVAICNKKDVYSKSYGSLLAYQRAREKQLFTVKEISVGDNTKKGKVENIYSFSGKKLYLIGEYLYSEEDLK